MITIQVTNGIPDRELTAQELQSVRYVYNQHVNTNGDHCYIEFGDETSTDTAVIAAYADIQTQLENEETNPDGVFFRNVLNQTPDSQILRMMQHITAAQNAQ
jgi:hypothetical protein